MARLGSKRKPTFFWQGALIMMPVVVLAALGSWSLRQDKALARHDATERAQAIAEDLVRRIWVELTAQNKADQLEHHAFKVDSAGQLLFPPPCGLTPNPQPLRAAELDARQARLWGAAQQAEAGGRDLDSARQAYSDFIASDPPAAFAAAACYSLGLVLAKQGSPQAAAENLVLMLGKYPDARVESGLPLRPLAQFKLLELQAIVTNPVTAKASVSVEQLCSNAVHQPTLLTPQLLDEIRACAGSARAKETAQAWQHVWQEHEWSRELFAAASTHFRASSRGTASLLSLKSASSAVEATAFSAPVAAPEPLCPSAFWFSTPAESAHFSTRPTELPPFGPDMNAHSWLGTRVEDGGAHHWFVCRPEREVGSRLTALVRDSRQVPDYFGIGVEVAGKRPAGFTPDLRVWRLDRYMSKGGGQERKEYASNMAADILASAAKAGAGASLLKVTVSLTSPTTLFERQSARTFWFGSLIATAALAALVGLIAAYRAFQRQLHLSEMKSNFVSSVSHELRAPIASVRLMAESLERGKIPDAPKQQEYFRFIVQECRRLSSLIENVLDFSRIEQGRKQYEFEPTDLVALTRQTAKLMETYAAERQVQLTLDLSGYPLSTTDYQPALDGKALQQALVNLIDNAIKHSPKGDTVRVGLQMQNEECRMKNEESVVERPKSKVQSSAAELDSREPEVTHHASRITLWVEDHGPGIPLAEHEKIFERFYRRGSELRRETQGVGIGLSIVKHIVEAHGGRVRVRSEVGQGSRFTIELPLQPAGTKSETRIPKPE